MDLDNDHSENPSDWIGLDEIKERFSGVKLGIVYSRNHNKEKEEDLQDLEYTYIFHSSLSQI